MKEHPIIDGHIHCGRWTEGQVGWPHATIDEVRAALDRSGIDGAVLMPTDAGDNEGLLRAMDGDDGRFHLFAWVDPHRHDDTMRFLEEHAADVAGLKFHPSLARVKATDPLWRPFLEHADRHRLPVIIHSGRWQEMASWRFCLEAAERHPEAPIIIAHLGGDLPTLQQDCSAEMKVRALPNAYLGTEPIREYYSIRIALDRLGPERLLFGSDYPLGWPGAYLSVFDGASPTAEERSLVLGGNLLRLIRSRRAV